MKNFPKSLMLKQAMRIVHDFSLLSFVDYSFTMFDASLMSAFVEQWHKETYFFHLPFGEMIITLDDVSFLFHLPIAGRFFTTLVIS